MPRKKSRAAEVDGHPYRFIVQALDHGMVRVTVEDQVHPSRPLYAEVNASDTPFRGIGAPQVAVLVRAGIQAGWKPATVKGSFQLDNLLAGWAIGDDYRTKCQPYGVGALLQDYLAKGATDKVDAALGRLDPSDFEAYSILAILRVTKGAALPNRAKFVEQAAAVLRERDGAERAYFILQSREAL